VGGAGAAPAARQEAGAPAGMDETAAHRRDPVADPDRRALAGRAAGLRAVADGLRPVPPLAAERDLAEDPDRPAGTRRCGRADHLGRVRGFHGGAGAPARRRGTQARRSAGRAAGRDRDRALRSRPGPVPRRADHQGAPGLRAAPEAALGRDHRGAARRQPAVPGRPGAHRRPPVRAGASPDPPGPGAGGQGLRVPRQPRLPAAPRDPVHHPGESRPGPPPEEQRPRWRTPARLRPGRLQGPPCRGMRHRPAQAQPRRGHPLRQAGRPLRGHRLHRRNQRMALTPTFETRPSTTGAGRGCGWPRSSAPSPG
jgi:hypothetical protein